MAGSPAPPHTSGSSPVGIARRVAKAVLPRRVRAVLHRMDYLGRYVLAYKPDRRLLRRVIFPAILRDDEHGKLLFVGVELYTVPYLWQLRSRELWTLEPDVARKRYGSRRHHIVDRI